MSSGRQEHQETCVCERCWEGFSKPAYFESPQTTAQFNDFFDTEAEARLGWGLYQLIKAIDKKVPPTLWEQTTPPFPEDKPQERVIHLLESLSSRLARIERHLVRPSEGKTGAVELGQEVSDDGA